MTQKIASRIAFDPSLTPPLATSSPSSSFLSIESTNTPTISETPKQSSKIHRTPFKLYVRPLKRGILGPAPSTSRVATEDPKRPSPPPPFRPYPKKPRHPQGIPEAPPQENHSQGHHTCETQPASYTQSNVSYPTTHMSSQPLNPPTVPSHISSESVLKCLLPNTLSLTNKIPEFHQLAHDTNPHLICIMETWLTSEIPEGEHLILGFNLYRTDSSRGRAGGVGVYASTLLPPPLSTHPILPATIDALNLKFSLGATDHLLLVVVYRSALSDVSDDLALLDMVRDQSITHFLIVGDFNAPQIDWSSIASTDQNFVCKLPAWSSELNWTQHVTQPTRFRVRQNTSVLDLVCTNEPDFVDQIEFLPPVGKSDHLILSYDFLTKWPSAELTLHLVRSFKRTDFSSMCGFISSCLTYTLPPTVSELHNHLLSSIVQADLHHVPRIRVKHRCINALTRRI